MLDSLPKFWSFKQASRRGQPDYGEYAEAAQIDNESQESLLEQHEKRVAHKKSFIAKVLWGFGLFIKVAFVSSYVFLIWYALKSRYQKVCVDGNENIFNDIPLIYETRSFERAGFHDSRHAITTVYEGPPNNENDAAWERLLDVGVISISEQENSRLVNGSAASLQNPKEYVVQLEMFHQLHCLKWVRDQFWGMENAISTREVVLDIPQRVNHTDHCIDYLRQTIMCHGDVTPMTFEWNQEIDGYLAHHSITHQCRNFDAIYGWAAERDTTGLSAGGNHKNVELQHPEIFD